MTTGLASAYATVSDGRILTIIGSRGYLAPAVAKGNAAQVLGAEVDDPVRVTRR